MTRGKSMIQLYDSSPVNVTFESYQTSLDENSARPTYMPFQVSCKNGHKTKQSMWMSICSEYIENSYEAGFARSVEQVQRYMLREFGLSYGLTSLVLHDLARIGRICVSHHRIVPNRRAVNGMMRL